MTNLEKAQEFLSKVFNGPDARIDPLSQELAKMLDQAHEEGKVKYQTELLNEAPSESDPDDDDEEADDDEGSPSKVVAGGKPHPKKKR
jgi:hypothetical protein